MLTNEIRSQIDQIWNAFWSGGISNPLEVIEQITYLLFIKRLDELHTLEEIKATRLKKPIERRVVSRRRETSRRRVPTKIIAGRASSISRRRKCTNVVGEHVFPFLRTLGGDESTYAHHMKDARFTIPTPALLAKVVDMIDQVPMEERDTKGDLYEYMLGKIATRRAERPVPHPAPHHPADGRDGRADADATSSAIPRAARAGFLVAAGEYLREHHPEIFRDAKLKRALPP